MRKSKRVSRVREDESFSEKEEDGQYTYELYIHGKVVNRAKLLGRGFLIKLDSFPPMCGYGTKMMNYVEKRALEHNISTIDITQISDDAKGFFTKRGYELRPHPDILDEFEATKKLT